MRKSEQPKNCSFFCLKSKIPVALTLPHEYHCSMKLTITFQNGSQAGRSWDLTDGFLTVGRGGNCNVVFDPNAENMVSTKHAYFEAKADGFYLVDTKSTNGTFVNGQRVQIGKLNSGDSIQFGKNGPSATVVIENAQSFQPTPAATVQ
jgi:pSer/pThr/pTyr-binding forkhead associated (FHA) protein